MTQILTTPDEEATSTPTMEKKEPQTGFAAKATAFHLIPEPEEGVSPSTEKPAYLEIPDGVSHLQAGAGETPRLIAGAPGPHETAVLLEPVVHHGRFRLLLVNPARVRVSVNDLSAPRLLLLDASDLVRIGDGAPLEVALYWRPFIGAPPADLIGEKCLVCRTAFTAESRLYRCQCGAGLHHEEGDEATALMCALTTPQCPRCRRPIMLTEGYSPEPQFHHE